MSCKMVIAAFDFDGTITKKDTLFDFIKKSKGTPYFLFGLFVTSPVLILYLLRIISNWRAKQILIGFFFRGTDIETFTFYCNNYIPQIDKQLNMDALRAIKMHKEKGHCIIIVSASLENWIKPWANINGIEIVIATKIQLDINNKITGNFSSRNCYGQQKVTRLLEIFPNRDSYTLYAYGDSNGDKELIEFADFSFFKKFS